MPSIMEYRRIEGGHGSVGKEDILINLKHLLRIDMVQISQHSQEKE
jgi:hypothetical protein